MTRATPEDGRAGDVWRVEAADYEATVEKVTKHWIAVSSGQPKGSGRAYPFDEWESVLQRIREDIPALEAGDVAHVYIPTTDVYLIDVTADEQRPAGMAWFGWRVGEPPTPDIEDSGLYFDPTEEPNMVGELLHRPYPMLRSGDTITDAADQKWEYAPPFRFIADNGQLGVPTWPLAVVNDPECTRELNTTSHNEQTTEWTRHSGVEPSVFDLKFDGWDD